MYQGIKRSHRQITRRMGPYTQAWASWLRRIAPGEAPALGRADLNWWLHQWWYLVFCGLGVPSLMSQWGIVRNRHLYTLFTLQKGATRSYTHMWCTMKSFAQMQVQGILVLMGEFEVTANVLLVVL